MPVFAFQIQNADDVLITPLEKFRKEQIGAAKVRDLLHEPIFFCCLMLFSLSFGLIEMTSEEIQQNTAERQSWLHSQYAVEARVDYKDPCGLIATSYTFIPGQS